MVEIITFDNDWKKIGMKVNNSEVKELLYHINWNIHRIYFINFSIDIDRHYTEIDIYQDWISIMDKVKESF